jgi:hypothetical protein
VKRPANLTEPKFESNCLRVPCCPEPHTDHNERFVNLMVYGKENASQHGI